MSAPSELNWLRKNLDIKTLQRETGLSVSRIDDIIEKNVISSPLEKTTVRRLYRRTTYANLRDAGFSVREANKHKAYGPYTVDRKLDQFESAVAKLASYWLGNEQKYSSFIFTPNYRQTRYRELVTDVREAIRRSRKSFEDWINY